MKKTASAALVALLALSALLAGCKKDKENDTQDTGLQVSDIAWTNCLNHTDSLAKADPSWGDPDTVALNYSDGTLRIVHYNLEANCAFEQSGILVDIATSGDTIFISEYDNPDGPQADCICTTNISYYIKNLKPGSYILAFRNWYPADHLIHCTFR